MSNNTQEQSTGFIVGVVSVIATIRIMLESHKKDGLDSARKEDLSTAIDAMIYDLSNDIECNYGLSHKQLIDMEMDLIKQAYKKRD
jgi:hypothetical protein